MEDNFSWILIDAKTNLKDVVDSKKWTDKERKIIQSALNIISKKIISERNKNNSLS